MSPQWAAMSQRQREAALRVQIRAGRAGRDIYAEMVQCGLLSKDVERLIKDAISKERGTALAFLLGGGGSLAMCVTLSTIIWYSSALEAASQVGGSVHYYYAWIGGIMIGIVLAIIGFVRICTFRW